jgi:hypothetical protein
MSGIFCGGVSIAHTLHKKFINKNHWLAPPLYADRAVVVVSHLSTLLLTK